MHNDYAGCKDKLGWDNPQAYEDRIEILEHNGELDAALFVQIVEDYLLDFKDPHIFFNISNSSDEKQYENGFKVRRYENKLYITSVDKEKQLNPGEAIISLDNTTVQELVERHQRELMETKAERENWRKIIQQYNVAEVLNNDGNTRLIELKEYERADYVPEHSITIVDAETLCMKLTDFNSPDPINELVNEYENEMKRAKNLIIDVRVNYGGSTQAYASLEKYLFPSGSMTVDFQDYAMEFNCTERNTKLTIQLIDEELANIDNEDYRESLRRWKEETWVKHRGKGFVSFNDGSEKIELKGLHNPENIILLTDNYCGSAGDIFVYLCKKSPKVKVVGRPTMGVNDYSNLTIMKWNEKFELFYPTSRLKSLNYRDVLVDPGIKPDIYIPWTPEHIYTDLDMEKALSILNKTRVL